MRGTLLGIAVLLLSSSSFAQGLSELETMRTSQGVSELESLEEFRDVSIIQRRFLPKTSRFEGSASLATVVNDPFFDTTGFLARIGYYFTEAYGIEFHGWGLMNSPKGVTTDLSDKRGIDTQGLVFPTMFYGVDFKWNPIYGKMALFNERIIPFDLYFSGGLGNTHVKYHDESKGTGNAPTLHLGTGQVFAISKSMAFRWDFSLNILRAEDDTGNSTVINNLFLNVGMSFFFPEARYR